VVAGNRDQFILDNLQLVYSIAYRFAHKGDLELDDLISAGTLGLIKAVDVYDPKRGAFTTCAYPRIVGAIQDWLRELDPLSRRQRCEVRDGTSDAPRYVGVDGDVGMPSVPCCFDAVAAKIDAEMLLRVLPSRSRRCVVDYYWKDRNLWEIAEDMGLTESRVSQIISEAKIQMRRAVA